MAAANKVKEVEHKKEEVKTKPVGEIKYRYQFESWEEYDAYKGPKG